MTNYCLKSYLKELSALFADRISLSNSTLIIPASLSTLSTSSSIPKDLANYNFLSPTIQKDKQATCV
jgi:hypothetical protein